MDFQGLGITSDGQLREIAEKIDIPGPNFIGFAEDLRELPGGISILNLGDHFRSGTHWVLLYTTPNQITYFDSYGVGPEDEIIQLAGDRKIHYNTKQVQRYEEEHCGVWALLAAKAIIDSKKDSSEAIDDFVASFEAV